MWQALHSGHKSAYFNQFKLQKARMNDLKNMGSKVLLIVKGNTGRHGCLGTKHFLLVCSSMQINIYKFSLKIKKKEIKLCWMPLAKTMTDMRSRRTLSKHFASLSVAKHFIVSVSTHNFERFPRGFVWCFLIPKKNPLSFHGRNEGKISKGWKKIVCAIWDNEQSSSGWTNRFW